MHPCLANGAFHTSLLIAKEALLLFFEQLLRSFVKFQEDGIFSSHRL